MALSQAAAKTFTQCCNCVAFSQVLLSAIFQTKNDMHHSLHVHFYVFRCVRSDAVLYSCIPLSIWLVLDVLSPLISFSCVPFSFVLSLSICLSFFTSFRSFFTVVSSGTIAAPHICIFNSSDLQLHGPSNCTSGCSYHAYALIIDLRVSATRYIPGITYSGEASTLGDFRPCFGLVRPTHMNQYVFDEEREREREMDYICI